MICEESDILIHALIDRELDAGHAHEAEAHAAACSGCGRKLVGFRVLRRAIAEANLKEPAPSTLRRRIEAALPLPSTPAAPRRFSLLSRRSFFGGFAMGTAVSAACAASLVLVVLRNDQDQMLAGEIVSAHIRSLQPGHLTDVETSDLHTVKPWFNGKLDVAPPAIDLTADGFTLLGGRLDYIDGEPVAAIVYRRRRHVINLFVAQRLGVGQPAAMTASVHVRHWTAEGLDFWAVGDIDAYELDEFVREISIALPAADYDADYFETRDRH